MSDKKTVIAGETKQIKSGTSKQGRPYTLIACHDGDGTQVGTCFGGSDPHKMWDSAQGTKVDVELEQNGEYNGKPRWNVISVTSHREEVKAPPAMPANGGGRGSMEEAMRIARSVGLAQAVAYNQGAGIDEVMKTASRFARYVFSGEDRPAGKKEGKAASKEPPEPDYPEHDGDDAPEAYAAKTDSPVSDVDLPF